MYICHFSLGCFLLYFILEPIVELLHYITIPRAMLLALLNTCYKYLSLDLNKSLCMLESTRWLPDSRIGKASTHSLSLFQTEGHLRDICWGLCPCTHFMHHSDICRLNHRADNNHREGSVEPCGTGKGPHSYPKNNKKERKKEK